MPAPGRYWRQFSLRVLIAVVTVAALILAWFNWRLNKARVQYAAAEAIVHAGGEVAYSNQFDGQVSRLTPYPPATNSLGEWSRRLFGGDPTRKMVSVTLFDDKSTAFISQYGLNDLKIIRLNGGASITDASLPHLANCRQLQVLYLERAGITDQALAAIDRHPLLEELWLANTSVTDAVVPRLVELPGLRVLDIRRTAISDAGMQQIAKFPWLSLLYLDNDFITDEGLRHLDSSPNLNSLWLVERSAAKLDLALAATIPPLESLTLTGSLITDDRVAALQSNAKILHLKFQSCTKLTDQSLQTAATLPNLKSLGIQGTPFTPAALQQFKTQLPGCHVW